MSGDPYIVENEWLEAEIARLETGREALLETNRWQARKIERLRAALEQAVDDFGKGHCVCEETKQMCIEALAKEGK